MTRMSSQWCRTTPTTTRLIQIQPQTCNLSTDNSVVCNSTLNQLPASSTSRRRCWSHIFPSILILLLLSLSLLLHSSHLNLVTPADAAFPGIPPHPDAVFSWFDGADIQPASVNLDLHFFNADSLLPGRKLVFTKGDRAYIFDPIHWHVIGETSIAKFFAGHLPLTQFSYYDCGFQWSISRQFYFFSGLKYFRGDSYDPKTNRLSDQITADGWTGMPAYFDACMQLSLTRSVATQGRSVYLYDNINDQYVAGPWPIDLSDYFPGLPKSIPFINDFELLEGNAERVHIFHKDKYWTFNTVKNLIEGDIDPITGEIPGQSIIPFGLDTFISSVYNDSLLHPNNRSSSLTMTAQNETSVYRLGWNYEWTNHPPTCNSQSGVEEKRSTLLGQIENCDHQYYFPTDGTSTLAGTNPPSLPPDQRSPPPDPTESQDPPPGPNAPPAIGRYPNPSSTSSSSSLPYFESVCRWLLDVPHSLYLPKLYAFYGFKLIFTKFDLIPSSWQSSNPPSAHDRVDIYEYYTWDAWVAMQRMTYNQSLNDGSTYYPLHPEDDSTLIPESLIHPVGEAWFKDQRPPLTENGYYGVQINNALPTTYYSSLVTYDDEDPSQSFFTLNQNNLINTDPNYTFDQTIDPNANTTTDDQRRKINRRLLYSFSMANPPALWVPIFTSSLVSSIGIEFHTFNRTEPVNPPTNVGTGFSLQFGLVTPSPNISSTTVPPPITRRRMTSLLDLITWTPLFQEGAYVVEVDPLTQSTSTITTYIISLATQPSRLEMWEQVKVRIYQGWDLDLNAIDISASSSSPPILLFNCSGAEKFAVISDRTNPGLCLFSYAGPVTIVLTVGLEAMDHPALYEQLGEESPVSPYLSQTASRQPQLNFSALLTVEFLVDSTCRGFHYLNTSSDGIITDGSGPHWNFYHGEACHWTVSTEDSDALFIAIEVEEFSSQGQALADVTFVGMYDTAATSTESFNGTVQQRVLYTVEDFLSASASGPFLTSTPHLLVQFHGDQRFPSDYAQGFRAKWTIYYQMALNTFQIFGWEATISLLIDELLLDQLQNSTIITADEHQSTTTLITTLSTSTATYRPGLYSTELPFNMNSCCSSGSQACCSRLGFLPAATLTTLTMSARDLHDHAIPWETQKYKVYMRFIPIELMSAIEKSSQPSQEWSLSDFLQTYPQSIHTLCDPATRNRSTIWSKHSSEWESPQLLEMLQWITESEFKRTDNVLPLQTPFRSGQYHLSAVLVVDQDCHEPIVRTINGTTTQPCHKPELLPLYPLPRLIHVYPLHCSSTTSILSPFNDTRVEDRDEEEMDEDIFEENIEIYLNNNLTYNPFPIRITLQSVSWLQLLNDTFDYLYDNSSFVIARPSASIQNLARLSSTLSPLTSLTAELTAPLTIDYAGNLNFNSTAANATTTNSSISTSTTCPILNLHPGQLQPLLQHTQLYQLQQLLLHSNDSASLTVAASLSLALPPLFYPANQLVQFTLNLADIYRNPIEMHPDRFDVRVFVQNSKQTVRVELASNIVPRDWNEVLNEISDLTSIDVTDRTNIFQQRHLNETELILRSSLIVSLQPVLASTYTSLASLTPFHLNLPASFQSSYDDYKVTVLVSHSDVTLSPFRLTVVPNGLDQTQTQFQFRSMASVESVIEQWRKLSPSLDELTTLTVDNHTLQSDFQSLATFDPSSIPTDEPMLLSLTLSDEVGNQLGGWSAFGGIQVEVSFFQTNITTTTNDTSIAHETTSINVEQVLVSNCLSVTPYDFTQPNLNSSTHISTIALQNTTTGFAHFTVTLQSCLRTTITQMGSLQLQFKFKQLPHYDMDLSPPPYQPSSDELIFLSYLELAPLPVNSTTSTPLFAILLMLCGLSSIITAGIFFNCCTWSQPVATDKPGHKPTVDEAFINTLEKQDYSASIETEFTWAALFHCRFLHIKRTHQPPVLYTTKETYESIRRRAWRKEFVHLLIVAAEWIIHSYVFYDIESAVRDDHQIWTERNETISTRTLLHALLILAFISSSLSILMTFVVRFRLLSTFTSEETDGLVACLPIAAWGSDVSVALKKVILEVRPITTRQQQSHVRQELRKRQLKGLSSGAALAVTASTTEENEPELDQPIAYDDPRVKLSYLKRASWSLFLSGLNFCVSSLPMLTIQCWFLLLIDNVHAYTGVFFCLLINLLFVGWKTLPIFSLPELNGEAAAVQKIVWTEAWKVKAHELSQLTSASHHPPPATPFSQRTTTNQFHSNEEHELTNAPSSALTSPTSRGLSLPSSALTSPPPLSVIPIPPPPSAGSPKGPLLPGLWSLNSSYPELPFTNSIHRLVPGGVVPTPIPTAATSSTSASALNPADLDESKMMIQFATMSPADTLPRGLQSTASSSSASSSASSSSAYQPRRPLGVHVSDEVHGLLSSSPITPLSSPETPADMNSAAAVNNLRAISAAAAVDVHPRPQPMDLYDPSLVKIDHDDTDSRVSTDSQSHSQSIPAVEFHFQDDHDA